MKIILYLPILSERRSAVRDGKVAAVKTVDKTALAFVIIAQ